MFDSNTSDQSGDHHWQNFTVGAAAVSYVKADSSFYANQQVSKHGAHKGFTPKRSKSLHGLNKTVEKDGAVPPQHLWRSSTAIPSKQRSGDQPAVCAWLRRCMSTTLGRRNKSHNLSTSRPQVTPARHNNGTVSIPAIGVEPPHVPDSTTSGAAARAAAAAQNEIHESARSMMLTEPKVAKDSESGIGIEVENMNGTIPVVRKGWLSRILVVELDADDSTDPASALPEELVAQTLSYLDSASLVNAELVSHKWQSSASSRHIWKHVFQREFESVRQINPDQSAVLQIGGYGLGKKNGDQHWKNMWRARKALQKRWLDGYAAAIYLEGHTDCVYCVQFDEYDESIVTIELLLTANRHKILTGSRDWTIRIWDAHTYECIKVLGVPSTNRPPVAPLPTNLTGRGSRPFTKVFSPLAITETNFSPASEYHSGSVLCLQYDEEIVVSGSSDCTLIIWDIKLGYQPIQKLRHHTAGVLDVCFDAKYIVSCSKDLTICLWDRHTGGFIRSLTGHRGPVNAVQLRGNLVVSASGDGIAKLWNLNSGLCIKEFPSKDRGMACVEFSLDSRTILAGGNDQVVYQFDTNTGELVRELKGHKSLVRSLHLDSANGRIISGSYDTSVRAYDLHTGDAIIDFTGWTTSWILSAKADYRRIIATSQDSRTVIMDFGYQLPGMELLEG